MSDFFKKQEDAEPQKIKLGDVEFSQEELTDLVGAGKKLKELETTNGQPVDDILKSWGRRGETIGEQKKQIEELNKKVEEMSKPAEPVYETDEAKLAEQIRSEAKKYGLLTADEARELANEVYAQNEAGRKVLMKTRSVLREAKESGKPVISVEELLTYMADPNNPKDPRNAYEIKFKKELKEWESKQLDTLKNKGMETETKVPLDKTPDRKILIGKEALKEALNEHFAAVGN